MRYSKELIIITGALVLTNCATNQSNPIYQQTTKYKSSNPYAQAATVTREADTQTQAAVPVRYVTDANASYPAQSAHYTQVNQECLSKEANRKVIGTVAGGAIGALAGRKLGGGNKTLGTIAGAAVGGAAGYGIADKSIACSPTQVPVSAAAQTATITPAYQVVPQNENIYAASTAQITDTANPANGIEENVVSLGEEGTPGYYAMQGSETTETFETPNKPIDLAEISRQQAVYQEQELSVPQTVVSETTIIAPAPLNARTHIIVTGDTVYSLARNSCVNVAELKRLNNINDEFYIRIGESITIPAKSCNP